MVHSLTDFGSTFTKVALVDSDSGALLAAAQHPTTVSTDVFDGFSRARAAALSAAQLTCVDGALAASSAAGGLRMLAVGLVEDLTAAAARRAALSAGAKVEAVFSGRLTADHTRAIARQRPDVVLFAGGTNGGDRHRVLHNARAVAAASCGAAVVVACNCEVAPAVARVFERAGYETVVVANVLPAIDREDPEPARMAIRDLFIKRVVRAKGLSRAGEFFDAVVMPSPAAVLGCAELLAADSDAIAGTSCTVIVDVGGATTDVHSVIPLQSVPTAVRHELLAPSRSARTVEGDLGVRFNADEVYAQDRSWISSQLDLAEPDLDRAIRVRKATPSFLAESECECSVDRVLASSCIALGVTRHVGRMSTRYVAGEGAEVVLRGRDLREAELLVVTGGPIVRSEHAEEMVGRALARIDASHPAPRSASIAIDRRYIAGAAGLLATVDRDAALRLVEHELVGQRVPFADDSYRRSTRRAASVGASRSDDGAAAEARYGPRAKMKGGPEW